MDAFGKYTNYFKKISVSLVLASAK